MIHYKVLQRSHATTEELEHEFNQLGLLDWKLVAVDDDRFYFLLESRF